MGHQSLGCSNRRSDLHRIMAQPIEIPVINGEFTNGDLEKIDSAHGVKLQNWLPRNGKLVKTYGFGLYSSATLAMGTGYTVYWIGAYCHDQLTAANASGAGYALLAYAVNASNLVKIKYLKASTGAWTDVSSSLLVNAMGSYYHKQDRNPVIQNNNIMRFLPGNVGKADGTNESKGIWIGYIEGDYFDGKYAAVAGTPAANQYKKGFYNYYTKLDVPDITASGINVTAVSVNGGSFNPSGTADIRKYYKFSWLYDGNQEGLMSSAYGISIQADGMVYMSFSVTDSTHPLRITGMNIRRSDSPDGVFYLVHQINFKRTSNNYTEYTASGGSALGAYCGFNAAYIPGAAVYDFQGADKHKITLFEKVDGTERSMEFDVGVLTGTGHDVFHGTGDGWGYHDLWDCEWKIEKWIGGMTPHWEAVGCSGSNGAFSGWDAVIFEDATEDHTLAADFAKYVGGIFFTSVPTEYKEITAFLGCAMKMLGKFSADFTYVDFAMIKLVDGLYHTSGTGTITYFFFDYNLTDGEAHPYPNATSLKMNGQFGKMLYNRLFLGNIVLDPGDTNEAHPDWLGYSEWNAPDVLRSSSVRNPPNDEGGPITSMNLSFGSMVAMRKSSYSKIEVTDPEDPSQWSQKDASFDRGNIATGGMISVGDRFYPVAYDGFYQLDVNMLAASDETPLVRARISEAINDQFLALTDANKELILAGYDQIENELIYRLSSTIYLAYNLTRNEWRSLTTACNLTVFGRDQNGNLIAYDSTTDKIVCLSVKESVASILRTKHFRISYKRPEIIRLARFVYKSDVALTVKIYLDGLFSTAITCGALAATAGAISTARLPIKQRAYSFMLEISDTAHSGVGEIYSTIVNPPEN